MEGGSANDYDYAESDPINKSDLDGLKSKKQRPLPDLDAEGSPCHYSQPSEGYYSDMCLHFSTAKANKDSTIFYDYTEKGRRYDVPRKSQIRFREMARYGGACAQGAAEASLATRSTPVPYLRRAGVAAVGCAGGVATEYAVAGG